MFSGKCMIPKKKEKEIKKKKRGKKGMKTMWCTMILRNFEGQNI